MALVCGIYGYEITRPFVAYGLQFVPRVVALQDARVIARDLDRYNLTAVVIADAFPGDLLFRLEAVLSFIEHLDVIVTEPEPLIASDYFSQFPSVMRTSRRHDGGGAILGQDTLFPNSRAEFVANALDRLGDQTYCESTGYRVLFFKYAEVFRQRKPFIEVSYFLLFSGLETYVRRTLNDESTGIAILFARWLKDLGFKVYQDHPNELERSMDTYARLRNALFHNSKFEAHRKIKGKDHIYRLEEYYAHFLILVGLVVLKTTAFDDGHINWDAWIDRQLFR